MTVPQDPPAWSLTSSGNPMSSHAPSISRGSSRQKEEQGVGEITAE